MTEREKLLLVRFFLANRKLNRAKGDKTAKQYAEEMAKHLGEFLEEIGKR